MWSKGQGVQAADAAIANYQAQISALNGEAASIAADRKVVDAQLQDALFSAASVFLREASMDELLRTELELNLPGLKGRRVELERQRQSWKQRLATIERDPSFVRRAALLHATRGELALERQRLEQKRVATGEHMLKFNHQTLQWLEARGHKKETRGGLGAFWDTVTFGGYREEKAKAKCCAELGYDNFQSLEADLHEKRTVLLGIDTRLAELETLRQRVLKLLEEYAQLHTWTTEFEPRACELLRKELAERMEKMQLRSLHATIRPEARPFIAKADALTQKQQYLSSMMYGLQAEIADRQNRISAIAKTRQSWMMRPRERINGDKRAWLLTLPAQKQASTTKRVRFTRRMHTNVYEYDDYDDYDYYLAHNRGFLAYDAFAWGADEPMPYEGFSRSVIPGLTDYRRQCGHDRPDYDFFKTSDKQAAAEARAHAREHERAERAAAREAEREAARAEAVRAEEREIAMASAGVPHDDSRGLVGPMMEDSPGMEGSGADSGRIETVQDIEAQADSVADQASDVGDEVMGSSEDGGSDYAEAEAGIEADSADAGGDSS